MRPSSASAIAAPAVADGPSDLELAVADRQRVLVEVEDRTCRARSRRRSASASVPARSYRRDRSSWATASRGARLHRLGRGEGRPPAHRVAVAGELGVVGEAGRVGALGLEESEEGGGVPGGTGARWLSVADR